MSFDRLAPHYTWMEAVLAGPRLQRSRTAWLDELAGCHHLLIAGVGHGHFLRACAQRFPSLAITSVDASGGMLNHAQRQSRFVPHPERLRFVHAAFPDWEPPANTFDAIATHFFLDCFPPSQLAGVVAAMARASRPGAKWLITDFAVPDQGWRRHRARAIHAIMYAFFRPIAGVAARRVTPPDEFLRGAGFRLKHRSTRELGLLQSDLWIRSHETHRDLPGSGAPPHLQD
jgi:ubiquinone/menaquinone biosynthesis C-methylase UbiE